MAAGRQAPVAAALSRPTTADCPDEVKERGLVVTKRTILKKAGISKRSAVDCARTEAEPLTRGGRSEAPQPVGFSLEPPSQSGAHTRVKRVSALSRIALDDSALSDL